MECNHEHKCHGHQCNGHMNHHKEGSGFDSSCEHTNMFVKMADEAWNALFLDKAKAHWEKLHGKKMDDFAKEAVQISFDYHMQMMASKGQKMKGAKKMAELMSKH